MTMSHYLLNQCKTRTDFWKRKTFPMANSIPHSSNTSKVTVKIIEPMPISNGRIWFLTCDTYNKLTVSLNYLSYTVCHATSIMLLLILRFAFINLLCNLTNYHNRLSIWARVWFYATCLLFNNILPFFLWNKNFEANYDFHLQIF